MPRGKRKMKRVAASAGANGLVDGMMQYHRQLSAECSRIQTAMSAIEGAMSAMGGGAPSRPAAPGRRPVGRPRGSRNATTARPGPRPAGSSLKDYILKSLRASSGAQSVKSITGRVTQAGYPTRSANLSNQVSMALSQMIKGKQVRKLGRGEYTA